jgi:four helix bundle suffix protein
VPRSEELVANAALSLLNLACYLLDRQLAAQAAAFEKEGGFTERLYRVRSQKRGQPWGRSA